MIVVTAPTGNIGHRVMDHLLAAGVPLRLVLRDATKLPDAVRGRVEVRLETRVKPSGSGARRGRR